MWMYAELWHSSRINQKAKIYMWFIIFGENGLTGGKHSLKFVPHDKNLYYCNRLEQKEHKKDRKKPKSSGI